MENKIIKYKLKKKNLEEKIINLLKEKKNSYENKISKINDVENQKISTDIEIFFKKFVSNNSMQLIIIISGFYLVGKSTFIKNLEKYINFFLVPKYNIGSNDKNLNNFTKIFTCDENSNMSEPMCYKLINDKLENSSTNFVKIIECNNLLCGKKIYSDISDNLKFKIHLDIIPKDYKTLKNKFINTIIKDMKNNTSNFITNINKYANKNFLKNYSIDLLEKNINILKNKKNYLSDKDFDFLEKISIEIYNSIKNYYKNITDENKTITVTNRELKNYSNYFI